MMKLIAGLAACMVLVACSTIRDYQTACDRNTQNFPALYDCTNRAVRADAMIMQHRAADLVHIYLEYGASLKQRVQSGELSDIDARLAYAILYSRMRDQARQRARRTAAQYAAFLQGLANYQAAGQPAFSTTVYHSGGRAIVCTGTGNLVSCN